MKATVTTTRPVGSWAPGITYIEATTSNEILIVFSRSDSGSVLLGDQLEIDLENLDEPQNIRDLTSGKIITQTIRKMDVHDLRLPMRHGGSRFPSAERRSGA